ncbi:MAG: LacI family DNA-binding transcriptional regulator [Streptosporangiales bacterium]|nr:LacI family DNA-binding transcriptional regulator [Streptosporangiales bacterium]
MPKDGERGAGGRVTLQTLADHLGVSRTTVSNAYSRPDQLTAKLRRRILKAAEELGYPGPHPAARSLRRGRAGAIGLVLTETLPYAFGDPYAVNFLQGIAAATEPAGVGLLLLPLSREDTTAEAITGAAVDGFCLFSLPDGHPALTAVLRRRLPVIVVDEPRSAGLPYVGIDDRAAFRSATEHVLDLGHRRIAVAAYRVRFDGHDGWADSARQAGATFPATRERLAGAREACGRAGVDWGSVPVTESAPNEHESGLRAGRRLLGLDPRPTAIVAMSDVLAFGVLEAARELGLRVPENVSVVGFDDVAAAAAADLTTIRQSGKEKAATAARYLLIGEGPESVLLPHELVVRGSTGPPA